MASSRSIGAAPAEAAAAAGAAAAAAFFFFFFEAALAGAAEAGAAAGAAAGEEDGYVTGVAWGRGAEKTGAGASTIAVRLDELPAAAPADCGCGFDSASSFSLSTRRSFFSNFLAALPLSLAPAATKLPHTRTATHRERMLNVNRLIE